MDDGAAIALLSDIVATPSVSGAEAAVARRLVDVMGERAERAWLDAAGNAVGIFGTGPLRIHFLGHIDTVPGTIPVRREGDRLYGRGTVDAKGPLCAAVAAASRLDAGTREALTLTLIGAVEEEVPSSAGARHALASLPAPHLLVIGEPSGWSSTTLGYKGRLVVRCVAEVANAHSAAADRTAPELVVDCWQRIRGWAEAASEQAHGIFDSVQSTLQEVRSDSNGLHQHAHAVVGLRLPPAWPPDRVRGALGSLQLPEGVHLVPSGDEAPYRGARDTPLTRAFRTAIRAEGGEPRTNVKTGTSDMNVVAPVWNVPMLAYGPGDSSLDHTPHEHIELRDYTRAIRVLRRAMTLLAGSAEARRAGAQPTVDPSAG